MNTNTNKRSRSSEDELLQSRRKIATPDFKKQLKVILFLMSGCDEDPGDYYVTDMQTMSKAMVNLKKLHWSTPEKRTELGVLRRCLANWICGWAPRFPLQYANHDWRWTDPRSPAGRRGVGFWGDRGEPAQRQPGRGVYPATQPQRLCRRHIGVVARRLGQHAVPTWDGAPGRRHALRVAQCKRVPSPSRGTIGRT